MIEHGLNCGNLVGPVSFVPLTNNFQETLIVAFCQKVRHTHVHVKIDMSMRHIRR